MKSREGFAAAIVIFIVLALVVIGGIAYVHYVYLPRMAAQNTTSSVEVATTTITATATIDQSSLTSASGNPTITGTAQGVNSVVVDVVQPPPPEPAGYGGGPYPFWGATVSVTNGKWSFAPSPSNQDVGTPYKSLPSGSYGVSVLIAPSSQTFLASGTLIIATSNVGAAPSVITTPPPAAFSCSYSDATSVGVILQASFPSYINTLNIEALSSDEDSPIISEDQAKGLFCIKARKASVDTISLADKKTGDQIWTTMVNPQKGQQYTIDANSTAVAVLFITPYFNNSNPANAEIILSAIAKDPGISTLAQTIQSEPNFIDDFTSTSTQVGTLFQAVIQRVLSGLTTTTQFTSSTPAIKITAPTGADTWSASTSTQYEITWIDQGMAASDQEQLYLYFPDGTQCGFENGPVDAGGSDNAYVILPSMGCSGSTQKPVLTPGRYSIAIVVQDASGNLVAAGQSEWFNITQ